MNEVIEPILSMPQFILLGFILLASVSFISDCIDYFQDKKAHQYRSHDNDEHIKNTQTYYKRNIS